MGKTPEELLRIAHSYERELAEESCGARVLDLEIAARRAERNGVYLSDAAKGGV